MSDEPESDDPVTIDPERAAFLAGLTGKPLPTDDRQIEDDDPERVAFLKGLRGRTTSGRTS
jgi:hypothetical protein